MSTTTTRGLERAWGWVAHLRDGGTEPWREWSATGRSEGQWLPGAQQLELLRRLNARGRPSAALAERVLGASAPGRGRPDLELVGVGEPRFGPRPVDPGELPALELLRVATGLIAEDLAAAGPPEPEPVRRPRLRHTRYRLAGDPWLARQLRAALVADGRPPGGPGAPVHVLGTDLATMLSHSWTTGTFAEGGPPWPEFLADLRRRDRVPRRVDLVAIAERRRAGGAPVDVVLDLAALPRLVGVRRALPEPAPMAAHAAELSRQVAFALGLLVVPRQRAGLLRRRLLPRLAGVPGDRVTVPPEHRAWVAEQAQRMRRQLTAGDYPVVGDPDRLSEPARTEPSRSQPDPALVLDLALDLLLRPVGGEEVPR